MSESFVDLTYRGLALGRRVKLTEVRPSTGYLEMPAPMPVGTSIHVATDDGHAFDAVVIDIHEQVGGSDKPPGMRVKPAFGDDRATAWWKERVALPELPARKAVAAPLPAGPILPRARRTQEMPGIPSTEMGDDGARTEAMDSVDSSLVEQLANEPPIVDDGKRTIMMTAPDIRALGLEPSSTGEMAAITEEQETIEDDDKPEGESNGNGNGDKPKGVKRRRKRR
jgi:hypothetical protein